MPTIILSDDHEVVRRGLQAVIEASPDFCVIGQASNGLEAADMAERLQPDVLVVDVVMPLLNGLEVARRVVRQSPHTRVIILSMYDDEAYVLEALRAGAKGYVLKGSKSEDIVEAIREVVAGRYYLSAPLSERAIQAYVEKAKSVALDSYDMLTDREREVLQMMAEGQASKEIASRLSISPRTVDVHRSNVMRKLDMHSHTDVILFAMRRGLLVPKRQTSE